MGTICLQCGDKGFDNAFVYCVKCVKCLDFAVHRYCLGVIPETPDKFVRWVCDDCVVDAKNPSATHMHDPIPCQATDHAVHEDNIDEKHVTAACTADERKRCRESSSQQLEGEKANNNLVHCAADSLDEIFPRDIVKKTKRMQQHSKPSEQPVISCNDFSESLNEKEIVMSAEVILLDYHNENKELPLKNHQELEERGERTSTPQNVIDLCEDFPDVSNISAEPVAMPIWRFDMDSTCDAETRQMERDMKRGATVMRKVIMARSAGIRLPVAWNETSQPIEPGKDDFVGYIGKVARDKVPITCDNFKHLPQEVKQSIWDDIYRTFDIEPHRQKWVLQEVARLARNYRNFLTRKFLYDRNDNVCLDPPRKYNVNADTWRAFVSIRTTEQFKSLSKAQRKRAQNPLYPYRGSRLGFARIKQIEGERRKAAGQQNISVPRHEVWRISRENKKGEIDNANVQSIVDNMESLSKTDPSLTSERQYQSRSDLLALALQKPEHPGRVRGVGFGVSQREYFSQSSVAEKDKEIFDLRTKLESLTQKLNKWKSKMEAREAEVTPQSQPVDDACSEKDSSTPNLPSGYGPVVP